MKDNEAEKQWNPGNYSPSLCDKVYAHAVYNTSIWWTIPKKYPKSMCFYSFKWNEWGGTGKSNKMFCFQTGSSALFAACKYGHKEIVDILLADGADVNLKTDVCLP